MKIYYNNNRRLYYWGLLGIIPVAGFITGIILFYKAFKLKDSILAIIGFAGVLITPCFCYMYIESDIERKQLATISYSTLNDLVSDIEFYKLSKGTFPDDLTQLQLFNKHANIYDPVTLHGFFKYAKKYNYKKMANKYLVFSSGIDEIINTSDDIYPGLLDYGNFRYSYIKK